MKKQKKGFTVNPEKVEILRTALNEGQDLDLLKAIIGGNGDPASTFLCREVSGNSNDPAFAESTYVRKV